ncbi:DUF4190 domain-containing protein [Bifidobacterium eulemuris]|uniref:DUF4190 domain-containing protein n=1 Tax=Bifidobacterium eulemuris TaxID=1765219 RepID=A0A261GDD1_9BIFI|nr:DUF4190 domain-containing protein [Bifidobacterium eulemuris]OZG69263.1 hypothetical protein BEUL_0669 [Bifidobacterium eulemuris]QOL31231.1 DUF4190 domain-containing protein [Bifidobacterium eulemuris]
MSENIENPDVSSETTDTGEHFSFNPAGDPQPLEAQRNFPLDEYGVPYLPSAMANGDSGDLPVSGEMLPIDDPLDDRTICRPLSNTAEAADQNNEQADPTLALNTTAQQQTDMPPVPSTDGHPQTSNQQQPVPQAIQPTSPQQTSDQQTAAPVNPPQTQTSAQTQAFATALPDTSATAQQFTQQSFSPQQTGMQQPVTFTGMAPLGVAAQHASAQRERAEWNAMSITGFVLSFTGLIGLVLSLLGLNQTKRLHEKGRGLAIAGIVIGTVMTVALTAALAFGTLSLLNPQESSPAADTTDQSQVAEPEATPSDEQTTDAAGDETSQNDETQQSDEADADNGLFADAVEMLNYPEMQRLFQEDMQTYEEQGLATSVTAQGDVVTIDIIVPTALEVQGDVLRTAVEGRSTSFQSIANLASATLKGDKKLSVRVLLHTQRGQSLYDQTFTGQ